MLAKTCEDHSPSFSHSFTLEENFTILLPSCQGALCLETEVNFYWIPFQFYTMAGAISFQEDLKLVHKHITEIKNKPELEFIQFKILPTRT